jgi:D-sedoheptulose 7-phosphate isomerase
MIISIKSKIKNLNNSKLIKRYPVLAPVEEEVVNAINILIEVYNNGGKLITMGNGGSSADAEHICGELMKGFVSKRPLTDKEKSLLNNDMNIIPNLQRSLPAISLGVSHSTISAFSNDVDPDFIFAQQIWGLANPNDIVLGISTSGNSKNVVWGLKVAKAKGVKTIALTGESKSKSSELADVTIKAPASITHIVQELHLPIYHAICLELENAFFVGD